MNCKACDRPLRPYGTTIKDYPDTVPLYAHGECVTCSRRRRRAGEWNPRPRDFSPEIVQARSALAYWTRERRERLGRTGVGV